MGNKTCFDRWPTILLLKKLKIETPYLTHPLYKGNL